MHIATDLVLVGTLAAIWLVAGLLADDLPTARTAHELRRRTGIITFLVGAGAAVFVAIPVVTYVQPGASAAPVAALLPAAPALVVVTSSLHRLAVIRRGTAAFVAAPLTPAPPALRAAAAHPMVTVPIQVTGLASLIGLPIAGHVIDVPGADLAGSALAAIAVVVLAMAVRAGLRHSRLSVRAIAPAKRAPRITS